MRIKSGILAFSLALVAFANPCSIYSTATTVEKVDSIKGYKEIHTEELKKLMDSKKPMLIFDARKKITVGVLPGAKPLLYDADAKALEKAIGSHPKNYLIVVYCARLECPLSGYLAENLASAGYTNVYKYPEGIEAWMKTYPIDPIK